MGVPQEKIVIKNLGKANLKAGIKKIELLGSKEKLIWKQENDCVTIEKPIRIPNGIALVFKIKQ
jgi:alpha-L-fucosidase